MGGAIAVETGQEMERVSRIRLGLEDCGENR